MSGGVDSSVAAALLKNLPAGRQGRVFDVVGIFMRFWDAEYNRCCSLEAEERARQVARILDAPFYVFDFRKEFKKEVVDYFLAEYKEGRTPNPCVVCNKEIKFGLLLKRALAMDADFIATGHYVRLKKGKIFKAKDKKKDQSYFLWQLSQKELSRCLFPLGDYTKTEVRQLAKRFKLPVASTPDSQEVCFVQTDLADFLKRYIKQKSGKIVDVADNILGQHRGSAVYTIGQRRGIKLPQGPYWVVRKDSKKNILVVTKNEKDLLQKELTFKNANWIQGQPPKFPAKVEVKIRYRAESIPATIYENQKVISQKTQRAVTPGQSVVFYKGPELLGGAVICV